MHAITRRVTFEWEGGREGEQKRVFAIITICGGRKQEGSAAYPIISCLLSPQSNHIHKSQTKFQQKKVVCSYRPLKKNKHSKRHKSELNLSTCNTARHAGGYRI
jgi:hypothetical protein